MVGTLSPSIPLFLPLCAHTHTHTHYIYIYRYRTQLPYGILWWAFSLPLSLSPCYDKLVYIHISMYVHTCMQCCPFAVTSANKINKACRCVTYVVKHAYTLSLYTVLPFCRDGVDLSHQEALNLGEVCSQPNICVIKPL